MVQSVNGRQVWRAKSGTITEAGLAEADRMALKMAEEIKDLEEWERE